MRNLGLKQLRLLLQLRGFLPVGLRLLDVLVSCDHSVRVRPDAAQYFQGVIASLSAACEPVRAAPSRRDVWRGRAHGERGGRRLRGGRPGLEKAEGDK